MARCGLGLALLAFLACARSGFGCSFLLANFPLRNLSRVDETLRPRGPDATRHVRVAGVDLVHNLLHITGERLEQPLLEPGAAAAALLNGEVYNWRSLPGGATARSDGDVILPTFRRYGPRFVRHLYGEFALAVLHFDDGDDASAGGSATGPRRRLLLATDAFGTKPLVLARQRGRFAAASYASALERLGFRPAAIRRVPPNTVMLLELEPPGFRLLWAGSVFEFDLRQWKVGFDDWSAALRRAVSLRAAAAPAGGAFLGVSSGFDSGAVHAALAEDCDVARWAAFMIPCYEDLDVMRARLGFAHGDGPAGSGQGACAQQARSRGSARVVELSATQLAQEAAWLRRHAERFRYIKARPAYDRTNLGDAASYGLSAVLREGKRLGYRVFLSAAGGDEVLSDYGDRGRPFFLHSSFAGDFPEDLSGIFPWENLFLGLQHDFLMKEEAVSGAHGVEGRYPLLDARLVQEFLWLKATVKNSAYKAPIAAFFQARNYPMAPGKRGFAPSVQGMLALHLQGVETAVLGADYPGDPASEPGDFQLREAKTPEEAWQGLRRRQAVNEVAAGVAGRWLQAAAAGNREELEVILGKWCSPGRRLGSNPLDGVPPGTTACPQGLLEARDAVMSTALHWAAKVGHSDVAELLLREAGVGQREKLASAMNLWRETPVHLAEQAGHTALVVLLENASASGADGSARLGGRPWSTATPVEDFDEGLAVSRVDLPESAWRTLDVNLTAPRGSDCEGESLQARLRDLTSERGAARLRSVKTVLEDSRAWAACPELVLLAWAVCLAATAASAVRAVGRGSPDAGAAPVLQAWLQYTLRVAAWAESGRALPRRVREVEASATRALGRYLRLLSGRTMQHCHAECEGEEGARPPSAEQLALAADGPCPRELEASLAASGRSAPGPRALGAWLARLQEAVLRIAASPGCLPSVAQGLARCAQAALAGGKGRRRALATLVELAAAALFTLRLDCAEEPEADGLRDAFAQASFVSLWQGLRHLSRTAGAVGPATLPARIGRDVLDHSGYPRRRPLAAPAIEAVRAACSGRRPGGVAATSSRSGASRLCLATAYVGRRAQELWKPRTLENKRRYAQRHGLRLWVQEQALSTPEGEPPHFVKLRLVLRLLEDEACRLVFWSDADALLNNGPAAKLLEELPAQLDPREERDLIFTQDEARPPADLQYRAVNTGHFFAREGTCAPALLRAMLATRPPDPDWCLGPLSVVKDQCALAAVLGRAALGRDAGGRVLRVGHRHFNSMVPDGDFECGDPVLHMPGCKEESCADRLLAACPGAADARGEL